MLPRPSMIRIIRVSESRNLPLQHLGRIVGLADAQKPMGARKPTRQASEAFIEATVVHNLVWSRIESGPPRADHRLLRFFSSALKHLFDKTGFHLYTIRCMFVSMSILRALWRSAQETRLECYLSLSVATAIDTRLQSERFTLPRHDGG